MLIIKTKFCGPTNSKGARIKAVLQLSQGKVSCYTEWDYAKNIPENHTAAAKACWIKARKENDHLIDASFLFGEDAHSGGYLFIAQDHLREAF